jgi:hypothetical protein
VKALSQAEFRCLDDMCHDGPELVVDDGYDFDVCDELAASGLAHRTQSQDDKFDWTHWNATERGWVAFRVHLAAVAAGMVAS